LCTHGEETATQKMSGVGNEVEQSSLLRRMVCCYEGRTIFTGGGPRLVNGPVGVTSLFRWDEVRDH